MLLVTRWSNSQTPDLFYFAEHPQGKVEFEGKRYICACAYSANINFAEMPKEYYEQPWAWNPKGYRVLGAEDAPNKEALKAVFKGEIHKQASERDIKIPLSEQENKMIDNYLDSCDIVDYVEFLGKVKVL